MPKYKGYEYFYVNGSSHTKGGGFETHAQSGYWSEEMYTFYKNTYNVAWNSCEEVNWAYRLSQQIGVPCINDAMQGGGAARVVRRTYEHIESNWDKRHDFFIILEIPDPSRLDVYYQPLQEYFLVNVGPHIKFDVEVFATLSYFPKTPNIEQYQGDFKTYVEKFHNTFEEFKKNERNVLGLYSFCKRENIAIKLLDGSERMYKSCFEKSDTINPVGIDSSDIRCLNLIDWCINNKKQIKHETNFSVIDGHPGYFAHIEYATIVKNWLDDNLEMNR